MTQILSFIVSIILIIILVLYVILTHKKQKKIVQNFKVGISENTKDKMKEIFSRDLDKSTVFKDLPRFAHSIKIIQNENILYNGNKYIQTIKGDYKQEYCSKKVVTTLAHAFENTEVEKELESSFENYFEYIKTKETGDCASCSKNYLTDIIKNKDDIIFNVLKLIQQGFVMKVSEMMKFGMKYNHKDTNIWNHTIHISDDKIVVTQERKELSEKYHYELVWSLKFEMDRKEQTLDIDEITFGNDCSEEMKQQILHDIEELNIKPKEQ